MVTWLFDLNVSQFFLKKLLVKKENGLMCKSCLDILDCLHF